jgi:hypothetical protein
MNSLVLIIQHIFAYSIALFLIGLGISMIIGKGPMARKYTTVVMKTTWKVFKRTLKFLCGLTSELFKWAHSKL